MFNVNSFKKVAKRKNIYKFFKHHNLYYTNVLTFVKIINCLTKKFITGFKIPYKNITKEKK